MNDRGLMLMSLRVAFEVVILLIAFRTGIVLVVTKRVHRLEIRPPIHSLPVSTLITEFDAVA